MSVLTFLFFASVFYFTTTNAAPARLTPEPYQEEVEDLLESIKKVFDKKLDPIICNLDKVDQNYVKEVALNGFSGFIKYILLLNDNNDLPEENHEFEDENEREDEREIDDEEPEIEPEYEGRHEEPELEPEMEPEDPEEPEVKLKHKIKPKPETEVEIEIELEVEPDEVENTGFDGHVNSPYSKPDRESDSLVI